MYTSQENVLWNLIWIRTRNSSSQLPSPLLPNCACDSFAFASLDINICLFSITHTDISQSNALDNPFSVSHRVSSLVLTEWSLFKQDQRQTQAKQRRRRLVPLLRGRVQRTWASELCVSHEIWFKCRLEAANRYAVTCLSFSDVPP